MGLLAPMAHAVGAVVPYPNAVGVPPPRDPTDSDAGPAD